MKYPELGIYALPGHTMDPSELFKEVRAAEALVSGASGSQSASTSRTYRPAAAQRQRLRVRSILGRARPITSSGILK